MFFLLKILHFLPEKSIIFTVIKMRIRYDRKKLQQITDTLFVLTGISIAVLDTEYKFICNSTKQNDFCTCMQNNPISKARCKVSDEKLLQKCKKSRCFESHICHVGLYDAVMPLIKNEIIVGYVIMGRIRATDSPKTVRGNVSVSLKKMYDELPQFDSTQIDSIKTLIEEIIFESSITVEYDKTIEKIGAFISDNLTEKYTVNEICKKFCVSRNYLYSGFLRIFGMTVNEYIVNLRIERAKELLSKGELRVYEVCECVGIDNYTYFCRLFKKKTGVTPNKYKG